MIIVALLISLKEETFASKKKT